MLPVSWMKRDLASACSVLTDGTHFSPENKRSGEFRYITAKNIKWSGIELQDLTYVSGDVHKAIHKRCPVCKGDLLLIKDGATTGVATINQLGEPFSMLSSVALLRPFAGLLTNRFLWHWFRSPEAQSTLLGAMNGSAIRRLTLTAIGQTEVPIPPLAEQRRIVAKLDALTARLARARAELERVPKLTDQLRKGALQVTFSRGDTSAPLRKLTSIVTSGSRGWAKFYADRGPAFIRVGDVQRRDIHLDTRNIQRVQPPAGSEGIRTALQRDDIVITITADLGRVGIVPDNLGPAFVNQHVALVRTLRSADAKWIAWYISSDFGQQQLLEKDRGVTKAGLGLDDIRNLMVPLVSDQQRDRLISTLETAFARADRLEAEAARAKKLLDRLEAAILAKAFRGELVPQNPADEPATVLLDRIRAERASVPKPRRGRGSATPVKVH